MIQSQTWNIFESLNIDEIFPCKGHYVLLFIITTNIRDCRKTESDMSFLAVLPQSCILYFNLFPHSELPQIHRNSAKKSLGLE